MLDQSQLKAWAQKLNLSEQAERVIEQIRSSAPARRVQNRRGNVSGRYPSRKMGVTIQFESHRNELAAIYELEHDVSVLEFYDQPPPIKLNWVTATGRRENDKIPIWSTKLLLNRQQLLIPPTLYSDKHCRFFGQVDIT